jgi:hypothetical protein
VGVSGNEFECEERECECECECELSSRERGQDFPISVGYYALTHAWGGCVT